MICVAVSNQPDSVSRLEPATSAKALRSQALLNDHRVAANRRSALKSTGPRTWAGKYRSALNLQSRSLVPEELERELRARSEDPREFCRLQRDLAAIFHPRDPTVAAAVSMLACAWWQKARGIRQWVGAGSPHCAELDAQVEALLVRSSARCSGPAGNGRGGWLMPWGIPPGARPRCAARSRLSSRCSEVSLPNTGRKRNRGVKATGLWKRCRLASRRNFGRSWQNGLREEPSKASKAS